MVSATLASKSSKGDNYYLMIVRNVSTESEYQLIQNPYNVFSPKQSVFTTVQVRWNVKESELPNE